MTEPGNTRDVIVIGASAGGVDAVRELLRQLPVGFPAALLIVVHGTTPRFASILDRAGAILARTAQNGDLVEQGRALVAPPDVHLLVHDGHVLLRRGPNENLMRPAIDPLFRSAACSYGTRVIGVVLTGSLNDGTAGLRAIKRCGGIAVVQSPEDALIADMPENALKHVDVDYSVPLASMGTLLTYLATEEAGPMPEIPSDIRVEAAIAAQELAGMDVNERLGDASGFSCPECQGSLWQIEDGDLLRYRCHVGHAFTAEAALHAHDEEGETMLWQLMRSHQERASLARRMASRAASDAALAERLQLRARKYDEDAQIMRRILDAAARIPSEATDGDRQEPGSQA